MKTKSIFFYLCFSLWIVGCAPADNGVSALNSSTDRRDEARDREDSYREFARYAKQPSGAYRAKILFFVEDPRKTPRPEDAYRYYDDGLLIVNQGKVVEVGPYTALRNKIPRNVPLITRYRDNLILPGFIDTHIHYPQTEMVGAYGEQLLEWLNTYTFPTEGQYGDREHAARMSNIFIKELLRNGTTTALVFGTKHVVSVDELFKQAHELNMRLIAGKVMMDRNAPDYLLDSSPDQSYLETKQLIEKWHHKDRLLYAITPRFAPTSTPRQLELAGQLKQEYPDVYMHTHLSENKNEIAWVMDLFPDRKNYLDVYDHYGLASSRSVFAHGIHLSDEEFDVLHQTHSAIAFCPTSNLFLGSGFFKLRTAQQKEVKVGLGTDIGAGTSFNMFETLNEAYKVMQMQSEKFSAFEGLYLATLGSARALELGDKIGTFGVGTEADFVVIDFAATALQQLRMTTTKDLAERLFVMMTIGDDRNIKATYVDGKLVHHRTNAEYTNGQDFSALE